MLIVIASWIYIGTVCLLVGMGAVRLLEKVLRHNFKHNIFHDIVAGIAAITVYTEYFSLVYKISLLAHVIMLLAAILGAFASRRELAATFKKYLNRTYFWEIFFYCGVVLVFAFFASRGEFHTDTGIYHGQAIRWYEEYGVVKGLGNLQLHYAYNSAYLAFASIFSLFWLFGISLHTTTGFMAAVLCVYACHGLTGFRVRRTHYGDFARIALLIYLLNILCRSMSPATDFGTMMMTLYLFLRWVEIMERRGDFQEYALLSVFAVFVLTMKLSAAPLLLLACFPAISLVKGKDWRRIGIYLLLGVLILFPHLARNVILSGWLIYPFAGIDLFTFDWKIPKEYLQVDAAQITVWGRCLYDIEKIGLPLREWLPVWWEAQARYEKMLLYAVVSGAALAAGQGLWRIFTRKKGSGALITLYLTLAACIFLWFSMAPFIRYGLAYLLMLPALAVGGALSCEHKGLMKIISGVLIGLVFIFLSPYWDCYVTDAGVFVKQNLAEPYYLAPKDYDREETELVKMGEVDFYVSVKGEYLSYYDFPGSCYGGMLERSEMRGETIEEGFRAKDTHER